MNTQKAQFFFAAYALTGTFIIAIGLLVLIYVGAKPSSDLLGLVTTVATGLITLNLVVIKDIFGRGDKAPDNPTNQTTGTSNDKR